jgi:hypothetical protein
MITITWACLKIIDVLTFVFFFLFLLFSFLLFSYRSSPYLGLIGLPFLLSLSIFLLPFLLGMIGFLFLPFSLSTPLLPFYSSYPLSSSIWPKHWVGRATFLSLLFIFFFFHTCFPSLLGGFGSFRPD